MTGGAPAPQSELSKPFNPDEKYLKQKISEIEGKSVPMGEHKMLLLQYQSIHKAFHLLIGRLRKRMAP